MVKSVPQLLKFLWSRGFFSADKNFKEIEKELSTVGCNPSKQNLSNALERTDFIKKSGPAGSKKYVQKYPAEDVLNDDVLPPQLILDLGEKFKQDVNDLMLNYGKSGTCTAFMLRKILEKLIFLSFAKNGLDEEIRDGGSLVGLKTMIDLAVAHKIKGKPFLMPKTAEHLQAIKFLGDTAAHNPLVNVEMKTIVPQMPFIITAYSELSTHLDA